MNIQQVPDIGQTVHFVYGNIHVPALITHPSALEYDPAYPVHSGQTEQALMVFPVGEAPFTTQARYDPSGAPATWHEPERDAQEQPTVSTMPAPQVQLRHEFMIAGKNEALATAMVERVHGVLWLSNVWVHHEHRRKGYAKALLTAVIAEFGHEAIWLNIYPYTDRPLTVEQLQALYESFGFRTASTPGAMVRWPASTDSGLTVEGARLGVMVGQYIRMKSGEVVEKMPPGQVLRLLGITPLTSQGQ